MDIQRILPKHPAQLSGGENQRVAIARALIMQPAVVLMDEPTGNLDEENKLRVSTLISELNEQLGQTFIIVTHDPELAALGSFRIVMRDGKIDRVI
jgi:ABC-type lipoprotein export system ATPase subunit